MKGKSNYERIILILVALVALAGSGWLITRVQGFGDTLQAKSPIPRGEFPPVPLKEVEDAIAHAAKGTKPWVAPVISNKPVPLNKSVLLVLKEDQIFDLFVEEPQFRPPLTNSFLREFDLPYDVPNVGDLDADGDGFSNKEEFEAKTSPRDAKAHPSETTRLFFVQRISKDYRIVLKSSSSSPYQVSTPDDTRKNWFVEEGKAFGVGGRFVFRKFERKVVPDSVIGEKDVSEMTVEDLVRKNTIVLVRDVPNNVADYSVEMQFRLLRTYSFTTAKGDNFRIPGYDTVTYKVVEIQEDTAEIAPVLPDGSLGQTILVKRG